MTGTDREQATLDLAMKLAGKHPERLKEAQTAARYVVDLLRDAERFSQGVREGLSPNEWKRCKEAVSALQKARDAVRTLPTNSQNPDDVGPLGSRSLGMLDFMLGAVQGALIASRPEGGRRQNADLYSAIAMLAAAYKSIGENQPTRPYKVENKTETGTRYDGPFYRACVLALKAADTERLETKLPDTIRRYLSQEGKWVGEEIPHLPSVRSG